MKALSRPPQLWSLLLLAGCWPTTDTRPAPTALDVAGVAVDQLPLVELELPSDSRLGAPPPETVPLSRWTPDPAAAGTSWRHPLPIRPRAMFFFGPPRDIQVLDETGRQLPYATRGGRRTWSIDADGLAMQDGQPDAPAPVGWAVQSTVAQTREARLNLRHSGLDPETFARASLRIGATTRRGLLLPAPAVVAVDLRVPPAAELHFAPGLVPPETLDLPDSDGATLVVEIDVAGERTVLRQVKLQVGVFEPIRIDLSEWAGRDVRLRFRSTPQADPRYDYVLVADPIVAPRKITPRRVVLAFVDTLRQDRLGLFGYERPTSPQLDAWAEGAAVFEDTRSVAPWTLPSYRSVVTGELPARWRSVRTLPGTLRDAGWATAMLGGNVYLSSNFEGDRGWGTHHVVNAPSATEQVDRALAWLDAHRERDALLLVHFMDPHLPYSEPEPYRSLFAGPHPDGLPEIVVRPTVLRHDDDPAVRTYIGDRYDNNIRYVDDELGRLLASLSPSDLVVVFSDHGEELWEHDGFEHGHTLNDEVLRVPLLVRGPGVSPGRYGGSTSLLDITPTVLQWAGHALPPGPGVGLLTGGLTPEILDERLIPLGHPLYGMERWGVVHQRQKYRTEYGEEHLHDLEADPGERADLWQQELGADVTTWRQRLAKSLGGEPALAWRVAVGSMRATHPLDGMEVRVRVPGGVARAWVGEDANGSGRVEASVDGDEAVLRWPDQWRGRREAYVVPNQPLAELTPQIRVQRGGGPWTTLPLPADRPAPDARHQPLIHQEWPDEVQLTVTHAAVPAPAEDASPAVGYSPELEGVLRATGYAVGPDDSDGP